MHSFRYFSLIYLSVFLLLFSRASFSALYPLCIPESVGDAMMYAAPILATAATWGDLEGTRQSIETISLQGIAVLTLKHLALEERPDKSNYYSFPSGHSSISFSSASFIQKRYSPVWSIPAYLNAVLVSWSRLCNEKHSFGDAVSGGVIGTISGILISSPFLSFSMDSSLSGTPIFNIAAKF